MPTDGNPTGARGRRRWTEAEIAELREESRRVGAWMEAFFAEHGHPFADMDDWADDGDDRSDAA